MPSPVGIPTGEAFPSITSDSNAVTSDSNVVDSSGAPGAVLRVNFGVRAVGVPSAEAFGTATSDVESILQVTGIPSAEAFGIPGTATLTSPAGIPSAEAFGVPSTTISASPTGVTSAEAFGTPAASGASSAVSIPSAEAFGVPSITILANPVGIPSAETFGDLSSEVEAYLHPPSIPSAETFGDHKAIPQVAVTGISSAEAFGLVEATVYTDLSGIPSAEAFGSAGAAVSAHAVGIPSVETFGAPEAVTSVHPSGVVSAEAFGQLTTTITIQVQAGIPSADALGAVSVVAELDPSGIPSAEAFGVFGAWVDGLVLPLGINSAEEFGTPVVNFTVYADGADSAEEFGTPGAFSTTDLFTIATSPGVKNATAKRGFIELPNNRGYRSLGVKRGLRVGDDLVGYILRQQVPDSELDDATAWDLTDNEDPAVKASVALGAMTLGYYDGTVHLWEGTVKGKAPIRPASGQRYVFKIVCSYLGILLPDTTLRMSMGGVDFVDILSAGTYRGAFTAINTDELVITGRLAWHTIDSVSVQHQLFKEA